MPRDAAFCATRPGGTAEAEGGPGSVGKVATFDLSVSLPVSQRGTKDDCVVNPGGLRTHQFKEICPQISLIHADEGADKSEKAKRKDDNFLSSGFLS